MHVRSSVPFALFTAVTALAGCWLDGTPAGVSAGPEPGAAVPPPPPPATIENALSCATLGAVGFPRPGPDMQLFALPTATFPGALCNDGSPAILYFRPGRGAGLGHWLIELEGGGGCRTAQECADRYCSVNTNFGRQHMGSADYVASVPAMAATGIQSITVGPYLDYNHVFLHYCSSDGWAGNSSSTTGTALDPPTHTSPVTFSTRFNGNAILAAAIRVLRRDGAVLPPFTLGGGGIVVMPDLDDATGNVVIAGGSAGGMGVERQLDRTVAGLIANHNPSLPLPFYSGMIDSAFAPALEGLGFQFTDPCTTAGACDWPSFIAATGSYYPKLSDASCVAMHPAADAFRCDDPSHLVRNHLTTPFFLRQGETDSLLSDNYQNRDKIATSPTAAAAMTVTEFEGLVRQQAELLPFWNLIAEEPPGRLPGGFVPDCPRHDPLRNNAAFFLTSIGTWTWGQVWDNWRNLTAPGREVSDPAIPGTASTCF